MTAQSEETMKLSVDMIQYMQGVRGKFGYKDIKEWDCTFGMNTKGRMDDEEFTKYCMNSVVTLWPDAKDVKGHQVMIKADSSPGRTCVCLLACLRCLGFILYPGVPNTTAVTQETDQKYGPFKTQFRKNIEKVVQERISQEKLTSLQPWMVGLFVFGGVDHMTGLVLTRAESAFEVGFGKDACL